MKKTFRLTVLVFSAFALIGCVSSTENLKIVTASKIADADPSQVVIQQVNRGMTTIDWKASYRGGSYVGYGDDMLRNVVVRKVK